MLRVSVLNGPNLNLLGRREPDVYGRATLGDVEQQVRDCGNRLGLEIEFRQSNHEGDLLDWIHEAGERGDLGIVLNAGALTHTSLALHDAIKGVSVPVIEVHLSNVFARENYRHHSWISPAVRGVICGFGARSYELALQALVNDQTRSPDEAPALGQ